MVVDEAEVNELVERTSFILGLAGLAASRPKGQAVAPQLGEREKPVTADGRQVFLVGEVVKPLDPVVTKEVLHLHECIISIRNCLPAKDRRATRHAGGRWRCGVPVRVRSGAPPPGTATHWREEPCGYIEDCRILGICGEAGRVRGERSGGSSGGELVGQSRLAPTPEQQAVLEAVKAGADLKIQALAGTGKTSTLRMIAESLPDAAGQYVAFNKAIVTDAKTSFPSRVDCSTAHSLAFRAVGSRYRHRLESARMSNAELAGFLRCTPFHCRDGQWRRTLADDQVARSALATVQAFCKTADPEIEAAHVPAHPLLSGAAVVEAQFASHVVGYARALWADIQDPGGTAQFNHDYYLKMWQLSSPVIPADYIMFDEAQDADPVMLAIIKAQGHAQRVYCGDDYQTLYEWRGATNALARADADQTLWLTQSFRFGPEIARWANGFLRRLGESNSLRGLPTIDSSVGSIDDPDAILCRTNAGVFEALLACQARGRRVAVVGGVGDLTGFARACAALQQGRGTGHPELAPFQTWSEVLEWIQENPEQAPDVAQKVKLVERHGAATIERLLKETVSEQLADVTICTVHQAKGREWPRVRMAEDFPHPDEMDDAQLRIGYVAVTRGRIGLDVGGLLERMSKRGGPDSPGDPRQHPRTDHDVVHVATHVPGRNAADPARNPVLPIMAGDQVRHGALGEGTVLTVSGWGDSAWCMIRFSDGKDHSLPAGTLSKVPSR